MISQPVFMVVSFRMEEGVGGVCQSAQMISQAIFLCLWQ